jgi:hypothetical protein
MVGSVCCIKRFHSWVKKCGKRFADDEEVEMEVWKWLRQQSKDFYAASFNSLVMQWDKYIGEGCQEIIVFPGLNITFYVLYPFAS